MKHRTELTPEESRARMMAPPEEWKDVEVLTFEDGGRIMRLNDRAAETVLHMLGVLDGLRNTVKKEQVRIGQDRLGAAIDMSNAAMPAVALYFEGHPDPAENGPVMYLALTSSPLTKKVLAGFLAMGEPPPPLTVP